MRSGKLDKLITIERSGEAVDDYGRVTTGWTALATVRAEILQASTAEFLRAFGEAEQTGIAFRIRFIPGVTVNTNDRVTHAGQAYGLVEVKEIGRRKGLELRAERVSA
jgi:SPP1 family predicted phage head-tail adaptor